MSFGLSSVVLTVLGSVVGINATTSSKLAVIGAVVMIAIADAVSDSLAIHISEESDKNNTNKQVWRSTFATLITKFIVAITFVIPVIFLPLNQAILVDIIWGLILMTGISYYIAKEQKKPAWKVIGEHVGIGIIIILVTNFIGGQIGNAF